MLPPRAPDPASVCRPSRPKLRVPRPLGIHVPRPRVRALVEAAVARSLVSAGPARPRRWRSGPNRETPDPAARRSPGTRSTRDNDPARCWAHDGAASTRATGCVDPGHGVFPLGSDGCTAELGDRITEAGRDVALVLDEFEHLVNPQPAEQPDLLLRTAAGAVTVIPVVRAAGRGDLAPTAVHRGRGARSPRRLFGHDAARGRGERAGRGHRRLGRGARPRRAAPRQRCASDPARHRVDARRPYRHPTLTPRARAAGTEVAA
ncbi:hypothetical protein EHYA_03683 [Embleya hyalina]|uniref:Uncharacterized protein n=1 Tax=Embleya hyalina TaxID=516124 RepID=A0A401YNB3_9ACTN|nr:hypothetical protein EHYA_03683 [Embleya hyalina]